MPNLNLAWGFINGQQVSALPVDPFVTILAGGWACNTSTASIPPASREADKRFISIVRGCGGCLGLKPDGSVWRQQEALSEGALWTSAVPLSGKGGNETAGQAVAPTPCHVWLPVQLPVDIPVVELAVGMCTTTEVAMVSSNGQQQWSGQHCNLTLFKTLINWLESCLGAARPEGLCSGLS